MEFPDLNFLYTIEAIAMTGGVSQAATQLGVTQPTVSHVLGRLRVQMQDDLFVRMGRGIVPTPTGERVIENAMLTLKFIRDNIWSLKDNDPSRISHTFTVCMNEIDILFLLPRLISALKHYMPMAKIKPIQISSENLVSCLNNNDTDLAIGPFGEGMENIQTTLIGVTPLMGMAKRQRLNGSPMPLEDFAASSHITSKALHPIHHLLARSFRNLDLKLDLAMEAKDIFSLPVLVEQYDLVSVVPSKFAILAPIFPGVDFFDLPLPLGKLKLNAYWHKRHENNAQHRLFTSFIIKWLTDANSN